jgi:hypothetical protein
MGLIISPKEALHELSEPSSRGERMKTVLERVSQLSGLPYWRCSDLWYGKAKRVEQFEMDAIADALQRKRELEARNELAELRDRISRMEAYCNSIDPSFHRPQIDFMRKATGRPS